MEFQKKRLARNTQCSWQVCTKYAGTSRGPRSIRTMPHMSIFDVRRTRMLRSRLPAGPNTTQAGASPAVVCVTVRTPHAPRRAEEARCAAYPDRTCLSCRSPCRAYHTALGMRAGTPLLYLSRSATSRRPSAPSVSHRGAQTCGLAPHSLGCAPEEVSLSLHISLAHARTPHAYTPRAASAVLGG